MADMSFQDGKLAEAEKLYLDALKDVPKDVPKQHDATYGLSRIRGTQGRLDEAIELGKKAVAIGPDPHMLATLGDLYIKTGKPEKAKPLFDRLLKITEGKNEYLRIRAMFLADHDRNLPQALALAQKDFADRKDVYGYDALAWTLHKNGQHHEAAKAIDAALKIGVKDANVDFHAGMIRLKQGDRDGAREALKKALARNPQFSPIHADAARKTLAELGDGAAKVER
jgi:tetratricopeptide (TPR) repeat protein